MTEDPRDYELSADDLRIAADRLYPPGDPRLAAVEHTHETASRYGQVRSRLRTLADALEADVQR